MQEVGENLRFWQKWIGWFAVPDHLVQMKVHWTRNNQTPQAAQRGTIQQHLAIVPLVFLRLKWLQVNLHQNNAEWCETSKRNIVHVVLALAIENDII